MYNEEKAVSAKEEHLEFAKEVSNLITSRFAPKEQNETLKRIYELIREQRQITIDNAEKHLAYLKETMQGL